VLFRNVGLAVGLTAGFCALAVEVAACSGSSTSAPGLGTNPLLPGSNASCPDAGLRVAFNPMYSAYDGTHTFQIPAIVVGSSGTVTWKADSSMVGMQADAQNKNGVMITMLKAGTVTIELSSSDGKCGVAQLYISQASPSDWAIGNARYNNGTTLDLSGTMSGTGSPLEKPSGGPACTSCHGETATTGPFTDVSHTPEQTGGFSDDDLVNIIVHGQFPDGGYFDNSIVSYFAWHGFHQWSDITADHQKGIITYLRSLTPEPQKGSVNFGAFDVDSGGGDEDAEAEAAAAAVDATAAADAAIDATLVDAAPPADAGIDANNNEAGAD
jgi:hypothetical protein